MKNVVILGAGPAGLAAALEMSRKGYDVTILEKQQHVGGNAASFNFDGVYVDFGSHRLHPASDPVVLDNIRSLLGEDLLTRPRHGRIRLMGRWIHFPLRPVDLLLRMHPRFALGVIWDMLVKLVPGKKSDENYNETFASVLQKGLGKTICREFYFPYARKIWGLDSHELSPIQARKRVSAGSIWKMLKRLLPGGTGSGGANTKGIFYYPRLGFGQIAEKYHEAVIASGARTLLGAKINKIRAYGSKHVIEIELNNKREEISADYIFSTIPVTTLVSLLDPAPPGEILKASNSLEFRSMVLVYLQLSQNQFTEYDAHYFPGIKLPFTRISEPRNYTDRETPIDKTVLCAEIPCFHDDSVWNLDDTGLRDLVQKGMAEAGLVIKSDVIAVKSIHIQHAYPLYRTGYEDSFNTIDKWLDRLDGVISFGRQGLYVHDNTHHAIYMAIRAADCMGDDGIFDKRNWHESRKQFEKHVVED